MPEKSNGLTNFKKIVAMGALAIVGLSSNAMAADPEWFTAVTTELGGIPTMITAILITLVAIFIAPIAWGKIKYVLQRG